MDGDESGSDKLPPKTDCKVLLPSEDYILDSWAVSEGSAVRAGEIIAYARPRGDGSSDKTNTAVGTNPGQPTTTSKPVHKRPSRRKRPQASNKSTAAAPPPPVSTIESLQSAEGVSKKSQIDSASTPSSSDTSIKNQAEKPRSQGSTPIDRKVPIRATVGGILRHSSIDSPSPTNETTNQLLVVGRVEECSHPQFVFGVCAVCGMPEAEARKSQMDKTNDDNGDDNRKEAGGGGQLVTVAGGATLAISEKESQLMAQQEKERLLKAKKLSLVLDLDHTLLHATPDNRAGQFHTSSGNLDSHPDVRSIRLRFIPIQPNPKPGQYPSTVKHYVKLRPHVNNFFKAIQSKYEVSVYTAGTREYAEQIVLILSRSLVGSHRDWDEIEALRQQVEKAQAEYDKIQRTMGPTAGNSNVESSSVSVKETMEAGLNKKRKAGSSIDGEKHSPRDDGSEIQDSDYTHSQPVKKKRKGVSFGLPVPTVGNDSKNQKSDHITKEKLEELKSELENAYKLEDKARELRQTLFGNRLVTRTDVGDLGSDVKSLKRIFPCGGTMAVAVDDREDVWANAKDNDSITKKGEPPANLLPVRPYHWSRFQGMKDINNTSGIDPTANANKKDGSDPNEESDQSLLWIKDILERLYARYFQQIEKGGQQAVPETLKEMREEVLSGKTLVFSGLVPRHKMDRFKAGGARPTVVRWAQNLGAKIQETVQYGVTHVVTGKEHAGSQKSLDALKTSGCVLVQDTWLFESYWSMTDRDIRTYLIGTGRGNIPTTTLPPPQYLESSYPEIPSTRNLEGSPEDDSHMHASNSNMEIDDNNTGHAATEDYKDESNDNDDDDDDDDFDDEFAAAFEEEFRCQ